jgi:hypothetical protein
MKVHILPGCFPPPERPIVMLATGPLIGQLATQCGWLVIVTIVAWGPGDRLMARADDAQQVVPAESIEFFERDVRPLLLEHCSACHSEKVGNTKGGLSLDSRQAMLAGGDSGAAVVPGNVDESLLVEAIRRESYEMPPEKPLAEKDRLTLERWIEMGAPWGVEAAEAAQGDWLAARASSHWAWQPIVTPTVPRSENDNWSTGPIDRFVLDKLHGLQLSPAARASDGVLLRRICFDLTGLPPTAELQERYRGGLDEEQLRRLVDELMASPQFGVRWGRHWLDLVRYAETLGHEFDYPLHHAWRYRDMVIDAINIDLPYDRFVQEQIAGDRLSERRYHPLTGVDQTLTATGWWWLGDSVHAPVDVKQDWAQRLENQIDVFSKAFVGMTLACARCHDHKFDALSLDDYYGMSAIIESTRRQYAITDPSGEIAAQQARMRAAIEQSAAPEQSEPGPFHASSVATWLEEMQTAYVQLGEEERKSLRSDAPALIPLLELLVIDDEETFTEQWRQWRASTLQAEADFEAWEAESVLFADFEHGLPAGWTLQAINASFPVNPWDWFSSELPRPARRGTFSSHATGMRQSLRLSSPTFDVDRTHVCLKMRGKSAQSAVVVSHYFMQEFHGLLFGDMRKPIDQPHDAGWVVHGGDLNKYLGHPAFLSIEDEEGAWFELEQVRFANRPPPGLRPPGLLVRWAERELTSPSELRELLSDSLTKALGAAFSDLSATAEAIELARLAIPLTSALIPATSNRLVPESLIARQQTLKAIDAAAPRPTLLLAAYDGTGRDGAIAVRGNPHQRGASAARSCMTRVVPFAEAVPEGSGRWELAQSLTHTDHPLTSRVIVNRVWHHLLGRGLASTPDNLGVLGGRPSHPELLDFLAQQFVQHDWSVKWLIREIIASQTYQLDSQADERLLELDSEGRYLSHRRVRRLSAEALRDAMLAATGALDSNLGGPSIAVHLTDKMTGRGRPGQSGPLDGQGRRTAFVEVRRNFLNPLLMSFDFPMPSTTVGDRNVSNVPAQALGLLNDPLTAALAQRWTKRLDGEVDTRQRLMHMFESAFARPASTDEIQECLSLIDSGDLTWADLAHTLLNAKEFLYVR